jgi:hypothetical protein
MNIKRFLHVLAIMFSSFITMISHGHAQNVVVKKEKKSGSGQLSKPGHQAGADAKQDPPPKDDEDAPPPRINPALMASAEGSTGTLFQPTATVPYPTVQFNTTGTASSANSETTRYPWKQKIVTTTFWVGETPTKNNPVHNTASSWDKNWAANYGGFDTPDSSARKEFIPVDFTPRQNPFYVALPYNDMERTGFKAEASKVVPWFKSDYRGPLQSVCKDRWVAIRHGNKVVYAQWEDCGPFCTDHWEYVFGNERPKPNLNHGAGLDVSPAVRDYLGMDSTDVTDWRFVDFEEVPPGPWSKLGENNTFVINQRKQTERLAKAEITESRRLEEARDRAYERDGYQ